MIFKNNYFGSVCCAATTHVFILITMSSFIFMFASNMIRTNVSTPVANVHNEKRQKPLSINTYLNTLAVDTFTQPDPKNDSIFSNPNNFLQEKLLYAEKVYQAAIKARHTWLATFFKNDTSKVIPWDIKRTTHIWNYFPPAFHCQHEVERVGRLGHGGKWICGMKLYTTPPKPEECVVYIFGEDSSPGGSSVLERDLLKRTECHLFKFEFNQTLIHHPRCHLFPTVKIGDVNGNMRKTLRTIMAENDHGWIDILIMDIGGRELIVLEQIMQDYNEVLPFGQLQVEIHIPPEKETKNQLKKKLKHEMFTKFFKWFEKLEEKGLRPFHSEASFLEGCGRSCNSKIRKKRNNVGDGKCQGVEAVMEYAFFNVRGKHLLLSGK